MRNHERPHLKMPESRKIGQLITRLMVTRMKRGISQRELAERMGTTQSTVSDFENHMSDPRMSTAERYAEAIGCRLLAKLTPVDDQDSSYTPSDIRTYQPLIVRIDRSHIRPARQAPAYRLGWPWYIPELDELVAYANSVSPVDVRHPFMRPIKINDTPDPFLADARLAFGARGFAVGDNT